MAQRIHTKYIAQKLNVSREIAAALWPIVNLHKRLPDHCYHRDEYQDGCALEWVWDDPDDPDWIMDRVNVIKHYA